MRELAPSFAGQVHLRGNKLESRPDDIEERFPRAHLASGRRFTTRPLWDARHNTWAHPTQNGADTALARLGLRSPTAAEMNEIASRPDTIITPLCNQIPDTNMATLPTWRKFAACVAQHSALAYWGQPVVFGKTYEYGGDPAKDGQWFHGFYVPTRDPSNPTRNLPQPGGGYEDIIQNQGRSAHNRNYSDYSQVVYGVEWLPGDGPGPVAGPNPGGGGGGGVGGGGPVASTGSGKAALAAAATGVAVLLWAVYG